MARVSRLRERPPRSCDEAARRPLEPAPETNRGILLIRCRKTLGRHPCIHEALPEHHARAERRLRPLPDVRRFDVASLFPERRELPLLHRRQSASGPFAELTRLIPGHTADRHAPGVGGPAAMTASTR